MNLTFLFVLSSLLFFFLKNGQHAGCCNRPPQRPKVQFYSMIKEMLPQTFPNRVLSRYMQNYRKYSVAPIRWRFVGEKKGWL